MRLWAPQFSDFSPGCIRPGVHHPCVRSKRSAKEPDMRNVIIEARGLKRYYRRGSEIVKALDGVDVSIREGEIVAILGPSGSGKTTLLNLLSGLDAPTAGTLFIAGTAVAGLSEEEL